jgi:hypothetical protein
MINRVLAPYLGKFCVVYMDDVLIYSKAADEHLEHIRLVLRELQRHKGAACKGCRSLVRRCGQPRGVGSSLGPRHVALRVRRVHSLRHPGRRWEGVGGRG